MVSDPVKKSQKNNKRIWICLPTLISGAAVTVVVRQSSNSRTCMFPPLLKTASCKIFTGRPPCKALQATMQSFTGHHAKLNRPPCKALKGQIIVLLDNLVPSFGVCQVVPVEWSGVWSSEVNNVRGQSRKTEWATKKTDCACVNVCASFVCCLFV